MQPVPRVLPALAAVILGSWFTVLSLDAPTWSAGVHLGFSDAGGAGLEGRVICGQGQEEGKVTPPPGLPWPLAPHGQMLTCPFLPTTPPDTTYSGCPGSPAPHLARHRKSALSALPGALHPFWDQEAGLREQGAYWLEVRRA